MNPEGIYKTIIVDDEISAIRNLERLLVNFPSVQVADKETDPETALKKIIHHSPDLVFMDIQMPGKSGFELVSEIRQHNLKPEIIFITSFNQYAIRAIRYAAFDYLLKPVNEDDLDAAIKRLAVKINSTEKDRQYQVLLNRTMNRQKIKINMTGGFQMIDPDDIIYIQADWNYSEIFMDKEKSATVSLNIGKMMEILPADVFFRLDRSTIINTSYVIKVSRRKLEATLIKDSIEYHFKIPIVKLRKLEKFLDHQATD